MATEVKECKSCSMCHKQAGLPILLTRYAIAAKKPTMTAALYGKYEEETRPMLLRNNDAPPLTGDFKAEIIDGKGPDGKSKGKTVDLGDGAQYTLRLLRPGYVYVFNPKDPDQQQWRGYTVTDEQYLQEFQVLSKRLKFKPEGLEQKLFPCKPDKNEMMARCITIPGADLAEDVWIGFSDTQWTDKQLRRNEQDPTLRDRHMRKINIKKYLEAKKHDHTVCVHSLPKEDDGWVRPIVAEYAYGTPEKIDFTYSVTPLRSEARSYEKTPLKYAPCDFDFSASPFQRLGSRIFAESGRIKNPEHRQELIDARQKPQSSLSELQPEPAPSKPVKPESDALWDQMKARGAEITQRVKESLQEAGRVHIKSALNAFTHLVKEFDQFYSRQDEQTISSEQFKGAGMILALDDAPAITMDLAGLIDARWHAFKTQKDFYRPLMTTECIAMARATALEKAKQAVNARKKLINEENKKGALSDQSKITEPLRKEEKLLEQQPDLVLEKEQAAILRKYDSLIYPEKMTDFFKSGGDYALKAKAFGERVIDPLAKAHAAWFQSPHLTDYFICNFDSSEGLVDANDNVSARDPGYREHGGPYIMLLEKCIGGTGDHPICEPIYREKLSCDVSQLNERNLLWQATNFNRDLLADKIKKTLVEVAQLEKEGQDFNAKHRRILDELLANNAPGVAFRLGTTATPRPEDEDIKKKITDFVRRWGWAWWDAICTALLTQLNTLYGETGENKAIEKSIKTLKTELESQQKHMQICQEVHEKFITWLEAENKLLQAQGHAQTANEQLSSAQTQHGTATSTLAGANERAAAAQGRLDTLQGEKRTALQQKTTQQTAIGNTEKALAEAKNARLETWNAIKKLKARIQTLSEVAPDTKALLAQVETSLADAAAEESRAIQTRARLEYAQAQEAHYKRIADAIENRLQTGVKTAINTVEGMPKLNPNTQYGKLVARYQQSLLKLARLEVNGQLPPGFSPSKGFHHFLIALGAVEKSPPVVLRITSGSRAGAFKALERALGTQLAASADLSKFDGAKPSSKVTVDIEIKTNFKVGVRVPGDLSLIAMSMPDELAKTSTGQAVRFYESITTTLEVRQELMDDAAKSGALGILFRDFFAAYERVSHWEAERQRLENQLNEAQKRANQHLDKAVELDEKARKTQAEQERLKLAAEEELSQRTQASQEHTRNVNQLEEKLKTAQASGTATQGEIDKLNRAIKAAKADLANEKAAVTQAQTDLGKANTNLANAQTTAAQTQADLKLKQEDFKQVNSNATASEQEVLRKLEHAQTEANKAKESLNLSEFDFKNIRLKLLGGGVLATFNVVMSYWVFESWGQELDKYKGMSNDKDKLLQIAKNDKDYIKARTMYYAAVVNFLAGVSDFILMSAKTGVAFKRWSWAIRMVQLMENTRYALLARGASSVLSFVGAFWDTWEAIEYYNQGEKKLAAVYAISAGFGFACGFAILFAAAWWLTLPLMLIYAGLSIYVNILTPDQLEVWLKKCYFGREPKNTSLNIDDWDEEIQSFYKATSLRPTLQAGQ